MIEWFKEHDNLIAWLGVASVAMFVASVVAAPIAIVRLPADYFQRARRGEIDGDRRRRHPVVRMGLRIGKNVFGWLLIIMGLAMLVLPGQGLLAIMMGVVLADFPGKYRLERWILRRRGVRRSTNWLRRKFGKPPFRLGKAASTG